MIRTGHIIKEQEYEIDIENQEEAYELQSRISILQKSEIQDVLDRVLNRFDNSNFTYQFDLIELNLGAISKSNYENELVYRIEEELIKYLSYTIQENGNLREGKSSTHINQKLEALEHFLEKGYFAWNTSYHFSPSKLFNELVQTQSIAITKLLRRLGKKERIRKRMISQYSDKMLETIVMLVAQKESDYIIAYKNNVIEQQEKKPLVKTNHYEFKTAIWEIVLAYLFSEKGFYDKKNFLRFLIKKVAQKYTIAYHKLLIILSKAIQKDKRYRNKTIEFKNILIELTTEEVTQESSQKQIQTKENLTLYLKQFAHYVNHGTVGDSPLFTSKQTVNNYLLKMLKTRDARILFYIDKWLQVHSTKQRILAIASKEVLLEILKISTLTAIKVSKAFISDLTESSTFLSSSSRTIFDTIKNKQTSVIFKQVFLPVISEKKLLYDLLYEVRIQASHSQENFIQFLLETKPQLSKEHKKVVSQFLNSFEQELEYTVIKTITSEIQKYTMFNDLSSWRWWLERKWPVWIQKVGVSQEEMRSYIIRTLKEQNASQVLINHIKTTFKNELALTKDNSDKKDSSRAVLDEVVPYVLTNGKLPWWVKTHYSWDRFNVDFTAIWTSDQTKKRLLTIIIENAHRISYTKILDDHNLKDIWEAIDTATTKNNAHVLQEILQFVKGNLFALGSISLSHYHDFKAGAFQSLLDATKHKNPNKVVHFIKKWGESVKIYRHPSLFEIYVSILKKYFSITDIYIKFNPSLIVKNEDLLQDPKILEGHNLIQVWQALDTTTSKNNASLLQEMYQFVKEKLRATGHISSSHYDNFKAGAYQSLLDVTIDKNPKRVIHFIKKWGDDVKIHRDTDLFKIYKSILEKYTTKTDFDIKSDPWVSAILKDVSTTTEAISLQGFIASVQSSINIKNSNASIEEQLEKLRVEYPQGYDNLFAKSSFRKTLISEVKENSLKKIILSSINTKQQAYYKQAQLHMERYQSYISHQEYNQSITKFNTLLLLKLSTKDIQIWTQKDWSRVIFHILNQVIGIKKHRSVIFDIQEKLQVEKTLYSKENQPLIIQLQKLAVKNFENTAIQNKKIIKEVLSQKINILEDVKENPKEYLLRSYPYYKKAIEYLQKNRNAFSVKDVTNIEKMFLKLLSAIDLITLNSWKIKEWNTLLFYSITQTIGKKKRDHVFTKIKEQRSSQNNIQEFTIPLENLSKESSDDTIQKRLAAIVLKSDLSTSKSLNITTVKELDEQVLQKITTSQHKLYKQATAFLKTYASYISIREHKMLTTIFLKFITTKLTSNSLRLWKIEDWLAVIIYLGNQVLGKEKHEEVIVRFRESINNNNQMAIAVHLNFFEQLYKLGQKKPKNVIRKDSEKPSEDKKEYKKLGEEAPHEFIDPMFITNAGLIIIAPYLGMLFQKCGLMENSVFKDEHSKHKAVQLLSYATAGDTHQEEHELVLHKILCGLYVSTPLEALEEISDTEKETIEGLLNAVIQHWTVLGNTTIDGLRGSFLQRQGKLEEEENRYYLKVEDKPYDMLLDQIPWNITKINLSWMHKILQVEWRV